MLHISQRLTLLALVLAATTPSYAFCVDPAQEALFSSLVAAEKNKARLVVQQGSFKIRIEQSGDGRIKATILSPDRDKGTTTLDDGRTWVHYSPKKKVSLQQRSPRDNGRDWRRRFLIMRNYSLTMTKGPRMAGRRTNLVVATARSAELGKRRFVLDSENSQPLKIEYVPSEGSSRVYFEVKSFDLKADIPWGSFDVAIPDDTRRIVREAPIDIRPPFSTKQHVAFDLFIPRHLPFGFHVDRIQVVGPPDSKYLAIRLTDGLAFVNVYQWSAELRREGFPFDGHTTYRQAKDVRVTAFGDVPDSVKSKILDAFFR